MDIKRNFLIHVRIGQGKPDLSRIKSAASNFQQILKDISEDLQLAYTSHDGATFGFFIKSKKKADQIRLIIESPGKTDIDGRHLTSVTGSPLLNDDSMLVLEIGDDFSGRGFSRAWTWLQHHK
jgi:hypothetical protein